MLLRLLSLVSDAEAVATTQEMARRLGVGEGLLGAMLEDAVRRGYLVLVGSDCSDSPCSACQSRAACLAGASPRLWSLTDKGRRLLQQELGG